MSHLSRDPFPPGLESLSRAALPLSLAGRLRWTLAVWRERIAARQILAQVDARTLREIGVCPAQATYEASRPFWRRPGSLR